MWEQIRKNKRNSVILVCCMALVLFVLGYLLGEYLHPGYGIYGLAIAFGIWSVQSAVSFFHGGKIFLAISKARKINKDMHPTLYNVVEEMKIASSLPKIPDVYIIDDPALNAFATGRNPEKSAVAVTSGLLEILTRDELQGVIAHELAHIKNRDVLFITMVGIMMGTIVLLADLGLRSIFWGGGRRRTSRDNGGQIQTIIMIIALIFIILSPVIAQLIYFAISRKREYLADAGAVQFTRYPLGLAGALEKIGSSTAQLKSATKATAPMYIANPFKGKGQSLRNLSSTHPPLEERIKILRNMTGAGLSDYDQAYKKTTGRPVGAIPISSLQTPLPIPVEIPGSEIGLVAGAASQARSISTAHGTDDYKEETQKNDHIYRARETTDALWKLNDYTFIECGCDTNLKIPRVYANKIIDCPHCLKSHRVVQQ
jgi:heat shock protein HtpX